VKLQNSSSDFAVCSTNGEQLSGDLAGFNELAHQLDKKRIVFYCLASPETIVLGARLIVRIIGGREERAVFIGRYARPVFFARGDFVSRFYDEAKARVENLEQIRYQVLGLLKEGDLPVLGTGIALSSLLALAGKVLIREPVKIRTGDLSLSFGVLRTIAGSFDHEKIPNYTIAIAQYSYDEDILISSNSAGMDLDIPGPGQEILQPRFRRSQRLFQAIAGMYYRERGTFGKPDYSNKETFSRILKRRLVDSDILEDIIRHDPDGTADLLEIYRDDPGLLSAILLKIYRYKKTLSGVDRAFIGLIAAQITRSSENPGPDDIELLKAGYPECDDEVKDTIGQYLASRGIFEEFFLKDLVNAGIRTGSPDLLRSVVTNPACTARDARIIAGGIDLSDLEQDRVLEYIGQLFESGFDLDDHAKPVYTAIVKAYEKRQFNVKKLNQLQDQYGRALLPSPRPASTETVPEAGNKKILIAIIILLIAIVAIFFFGPGGSPVPGPGGNQTIAPQTNPAVNPDPAIPDNQGADRVPIPQPGRTMDEETPVTRTPAVNQTTAVQNGSLTPAPEKMARGNLT